MGSKWPPDPPSGRSGIWQFATVTAWQYCSNCQFVSPRLFPPHPLRHRVFLAAITAEDILVKAPAHLNSTNARLMGQPAASIRRNLSSNSSGFTSSTCKTSSRIRRPVVGRNEASLCKLCHNTQDQCTLCTREDNFRRENLAGSFQSRHQRPIHNRHSTVRRDKQNLDRRNRAYRVSMKFLEDGVYRTTVLRWGESLPTASNNVTARMLRHLFHSSHSSPDNFLAKWPRLPPSLVPCPGLAFFPPHMFCKTW